MVGGTEYPSVFVVMILVGAGIVAALWRWIGWNRPGIGTSVLLGAPVALSAAVHPGYWPSSATPVLGGSALLLLLAMLIPYVRACGLSWPESLDRCLLITDQRAPCLQRGQLNAGPLIAFTETCSAGRACKRRKKLPARRRYGHVIYDESPKWTSAH